MHLATEEGFDIRELIPAPTNTEEDAGPYVTMGLCYGTDPETGDTDITIHRLCLQGKDEISMYFVPGPSLRRIPSEIRKSRQTDADLHQYRR